ncbi:uncharacterized protein BDW43DRAFT_305661 [Aspergillus alliaceus]|uniref:uncharacterized protein n=1 Tax=Petromyces alliaceus TaxID=209559 RepID=UPI0012A71B06|nr:uncharacterized protein BDW43DRAFT_305661 [Aspergillus alliaceus]KAB8238755.1 hypothetical protein BDW43DRAFT_305661 [Aspergillus alliaceus]
MATMVESEVLTSLPTKQQPNLPKDDIYGKYYPTDPKNQRLVSNFGPTIPEQVGLPTTDFQGHTPLEIAFSQKSSFSNVAANTPTTCLHLASSQRAPTQSKESSVKRTAARFLPPGNIRRLFGLKDDEEESEKYLEFMISAHEAQSYLNFWSTDIGQKMEEELSRNAGYLTDEGRVSAFNQKMNDGGFLNWDTVEYGQKVNRKWLIGKYDVGDVIFHNPWMVHASCKNKYPQRRMRLVTDPRFVDSTKPCDEPWMKVFRPLDGL